MEHVLITGGTGTFGRALTSRLLKLDGVKHIVIFSRDEATQVQMQSIPEYRDRRVVYHTGSVTDRDALMKVMARNDVDTILHTAALKHVPICEAHPSECYGINVQGSQNVLQVASEVGVEKVVLISTDKAAQPSNTYGLSKAMMERLMYEYNGLNNLVVNVARFGNLVGSRGSVLELFIKQIRDGGRVQATDPQMTRFFIRITQAATTVLFAAQQNKGGLVFVPQMKCATLDYFIKAVFEYLNVTPQIDIMGARPGEKRHELIIGADEVTRAGHAEEFLGLVLHQKPLEPRRQVIKEAISSERARRMDVDELVGLIREIAPQLQQPVRT